MAYPISFLAKDCILTGVGKIINYPVQNAYVDVPAVLHEFGEFQLRFQYSTNEGQEILGNAEPGLSMATAANLNDTDNCSCQLSLERTSSTGNPKQTIQFLSVTP